MIEILLRLIGTYAVLTLMAATSLASNLVLHWPAKCALGGLALLAFVAIWSP